MEIAKLKERCLLQLQKIARVVIRLVKTKPEDV